MHVCGLTDYLLMKIFHFTKNLRVLTIELEIIEWQAKKFPEILQLVGRMRVLRKQKTILHSPK